MDPRRNVRNEDPAGWLIAERAYPSERRFYQEDERLGRSSVTLVIEALQRLAREATR